MTETNRTEYLKQLLSEAEKDPTNNKLYIEDLKASIKSAARYGGKQYEMVQSA